jgi:hypothetical protein
MMTLGAEHINMYFSFQQVFGSSSYYVFFSSYWLASHMDDSFCCWSRKSVNQDMLCLIIFSVSFFLSPFVFLWSIYTKFLDHEKKKHFVFLIILKDRSTPIFVFHCILQVLQQIFGTLLVKGSIKIWIVHYPNFFLNFLFHNFSSILVYNRL